jgi:hypothetical protein
MFTLKEHHLYGAARQQQRTTKEQGIHARY